MNRKQNNERDPEMLDEYDFSGGVRDKYLGRFPKGANVVVLDEDIARVFTDSESVTQALPALAAIIQNQTERFIPDIFPKKPVNVCTLSNSI